MLHNKYTIYCPYSSHTLPFILKQAAVVAESTELVLLSHSQNTDLATLGRFPTNDLGLSQYHT